VSLQVFLPTSLRCLLIKKSNFSWVLCGQSQLRVKARNRTKVISRALRGTESLALTAFAALIPALGGEITVTFVIPS